MGQKNNPLNKVRGMNAIKPPEQVTEQAIFPTTLSKETSDAWAKLITNNDNAFKKLFAQKGW